MTEMEIVRSRLSELQIAYNDLVEVVKRKHSATAINRLVADLEGRMVSLEDRIEALEGRITALEEDE